MPHKVTSLSGIFGTLTLEAAFGSRGDRGPGFDTLRLFAASAVVLHHAGSINHNIIKDDPIYALSGQYTHLGLLAVAIFFSLSGYLVTPGLLKNGNVLDYLSRRFMRIMPLLVMVVLITAFVIGPLLTTLPSPDYFGDPVTWRYLQNITTFLSLDLPGVSNFDGTSAINTPLWSLHFEWLCYALLAGASLANILRQRWVVLAIYCAAIGVLGIYYGPTAAEIFSGRIYVFLYLFSYFGSGVLFFLFREKVPWSPILMAAALAALLVVFQIGLGHLLAPVLVTYLVVGFGLFKFPWGAILARSDLSYGVYLMHAVIMTILVYFFEFSSWLILFAVTLSLSLVAAWLSWNFLEKPSMENKLALATAVRRFIRTVVRNEPSRKQ